MDEALKELDDILSPQIMNESVCPECYVDFDKARKDLLAWRQQAIVAAQISENRIYLIASAGEPDNTIKLRTIQDIAYKRIKSLEAQYKENK